MWKAKNKATGREYVLTDAQKAHYETSPRLRGKYTFKAETPPKGLEKAVKTKKEVEPPIEEGL